MIIKQQKLLTATRLSENLERILQLPNFCLKADKFENFSSHHPEFTSLSLLPVHTHRKEL